MLMKKALFSAWLICGVAVALAAPLADSVQVYFAAADSSLAVRNFRLAQFNFEQVFRLSPNHEPARLRYAAMLDQRNQYEAARQQLGQALLANPNSLPVLRALFHDAVRHRLWPSAIAYGKRLAARPPVPDTVYHGLAKAYYYEEDYMAAVEALKELLRLKPAAPAYVLLAKCHTELNDFKAAAGAFESALALDPNNAATWYEYALLLAVLPNAAKAAAAIEKAIALGLKPTMDVRENLANLYLQTHQYQRGLELVEQLLTQKPNDALLMLLAGQALYRQKNYKSASHYYERAYKTDPKNYRALYMLGLSLMKDGKQKKGETYCAEAIAHDASLLSLRTMQH
jgi:tetratricopeptide (TPR) repeat protein